MANPTTWTTKSEIDFIKGIGRYRWVGRSCRKYRMSRADALRGYIRGCARRSVWTGIKRAEVLEAAQVELDNEVRRERERGAIARPRGVA